MTKYPKPIELSSYAKLNLFLNIDSIRDDGYHSLQMVNVRISYKDDILLSLNHSSEIELSCSNPNVPVDSSNTVFKAIKRFRDQTRLSFGCGVIIQKRIPFGAGLGGGSSNAAAVLAALNVLHDNILSKDELMNLGKGIGADVPFFLEQGCCYCTGIGDNVTPLPIASSFSENPLYVVVCSPDEKVSTPKAYAFWDRLDKPKSSSPRPLIQSLIDDERENIPKYLFNSFEQIIFQEYPIIQQAYECFQRVSPTAPRLTGSGSNLFSVHQTDQEAQHVSIALQNQGLIAGVYRMVC